jgi:hypothetical protein
MEINIFSKDYDLKKKLNKILVEFEFKNLIQSNFKK